MVNQLSYSSSGKVPKNKRVDGMSAVKPPSSILVEARACTEERWVDFVTSDGRHKVCFIWCGHVHAVCGRAKHTTFRVRLNREVEAILSTCCVGSA